MSVRDVENQATRTASTQCDDAEYVDTSIMHRDVFT